ncbi:taste receptor type 2 member 14-like [Ochotona curzoniae]|uniref:taste receptor type 2 member 14-like n=1 Tax=Ochotona curzoniae TaxID=130825 RepID=UPI001B34EC01|nr:taste receptor type 2 member 14-like [Ochotona curzoniae]
MNSVVSSIITVIQCLQLIIGNVGNGFIALVNIIDWVKERKISFVDQLLSALASCRMCLLWLVLMSKLVFVLCASALWTELFKMITISWAVSNHFSIWLATSLSIFYFLKIANFSNSTFLYLKWRVEKMVSMTLLVSLAILFLNIALLNTDIDVWIAGYRINMTCNSNYKSSLYLSRAFLVHYMIFTIIPFTVSLTTFLLLIFSLWRHLRNVQLLAMGPRDASTKAHLRGLQTAVAFLLFYAVFFLSIVIQALLSELQPEETTILLCHVLAMTFPSGHSCILILGNKKLRQTSLSVLRRLKHRCKHAKP